MMVKQGGLGFLRGGRGPQNLSLDSGVVGTHSGSKTGLR